MADLRDHDGVTRAQFFVRTLGGVPLIELAGDIDLSNVDAFAGCLSVFDSGDAVVLDVSKLDFIDSQGIAVLARTATRGVKLTCRGAHGTVRSVFDISRMSDVLTIED